MRLENASPYSPEVVADPYRWYRWLHDTSPVHHCTDPDLWVLSKYADVAAALRDPTTYSSAQGVTYPRFPLGNMITSDPPVHTRLRRIVSRHFTPAAIDGRRAQIAKRIVEFTEPLIEAGGGDLVDELAGPMPTTIIADLLGVRAEDRAAFRGWSDDVVEGFHVGEKFDEHTVAITQRGFAGIVAYMEEAIAERRTRPGDDLVTLLVQASVEDRLEPYEMSSFTMLLLVAGNETTTNLLGSLVLSLIENPDQWRRLKEDRSLVASAVEEGLRYRAPIQGLYRTAMRSVLVRDVEIPEYARVLLSYGAANRDPDRYSDPDRFDITRNAEHLGFGAGIHFCLGASLARLETALTLELLLDRVETIELTGAVEMRNNPHLHGPVKLPVTLR